MTSTQNVLLDDEEGARRLIVSGSGSDFNSKSDDTIHNNRTPSRKSVICCMLIFFLSMVSMEVVLEAATRDFSDLDSLASAVTLFQFALCLLLPLALSKGTGCHKFPVSFQGLMPYLRLSVVVFGATSLATRSVTYVSYPTKVIFKSVKLIPTMMVATILQGKVYNPLEYIAGLFLCMGAAGYSYGAENNSSGNTSKSSAYGILLLTVSIFCDAMVPNLQKVLLSPSSRSNNKQTGNGNLSATELMINTNAVGLAAVLIYMIVTGELSSTIQTCTEHPKLALYLFLVGLCLATAVLAYTKLIQVTDSVVAVTVATLRKVVTMVLSYVVFPKPLLRIHVLSGLSVLAGIWLGFHAKKENNIKHGKR